MPEHDHKAIWRRPADASEALFRARLDGIVLRLRPAAEAEADRMDYCDNPVTLGEWIGIEPESDTAHVYSAEEVRSHVKETLQTGVVLAVEQQHTRWGTIERGERFA